MKCKEEVERTAEMEKFPSKNRANQPRKHFSYIKSILRLGWYLQVLIATATNKIIYDCPWSGLVWTHLTTARARGAIIGYQLSGTRPLREQAHAQIEHGTRGFPHCPQHIVGTRAQN